MPPKGGELDQLRSENSLLKEQNDRLENQVVALTQELDKLMEKEGKVRVKKEVNEEEEKKKKLMQYKTHHLRDKMKKGIITFDMYLLLRDEIEAVSIVGKNVLELFKSSYCVVKEYPVKQDLTYEEMLLEIRKILTID